MSLYLVTGGAGFIGSHLVEALLKRGESVRVIDNFETGKADNLAPFRADIDLHQIDIVDLPAVQAAMQGVDYVLHQAAVPSVPRSVADPMTTHMACATGTLNILLAARDAGVRRVVYAASSSAYGDLPDEFKSETMQSKPLSPYAIAKLTGEQYCAVFSKLYGLETVALRYFNVFGPRQDPDSPYSAVIPLFIRAILSKQSPVIYGDGGQTRDFTYIDNVVDGNLLACSAPSQVSGEMMNLACGERISLLDLLRELNDLLGTNVAPAFKPARDGDIRHSRADISKAQRLLGYTPRVSLREGLRHTIAWFKEAAAQL
jgi:UDP-glucose 4-epimerase